MLFVTFNVNKKASNKKYTVIVEDNFKIVTKDLNKKILDITRKLDDNFDIIYKSKSKNIINNIYKKVILFLYMKHNQY